jgi:hypothetical protein
MTAQIYDFKAYWLRRQLALALAQIRASNVIR